MRTIVCIILCLFFLLFDTAEVPKRCSAPPKYPSTRLHHKFSTRSKFDSGEKVYYKCTENLVASAGSLSVMCVNGTWTTLTLKCDRMLCGSAGEIRNGRFTYTGVEFGDIATAHCDDGFQLFGRRTRKCMSFGWDGHPPSCEAVECDEPPEVANAERNGNEEASYKYKSVIAYDCRTGTLLGNKVIWCMENGTWSTPPSCREITCPSPKVPNASWTRAHTRLYQHRDTIDIDCRHGYTVVGASTVTCGDDGRWSPSLPKCRRTCKTTTLVEIDHRIIIVIPFLNTFNSSFLPPFFFY
ncbi:membrane cofactor protein-like isoform X1 [Syngnathus acus]|uniref:membrane cofactor protein-like isoform X1 n=1 Tax=Syngnathus acus TaxID=161584 RepID=UPI00188635E0|nr:membrane cofactor protein-like isoform X1 [Syngnathus acus]